MDNFWQDFTFSDDRCYCWRLGPVVLWIKRGHDELLIAVERVDSEVQAGAFAKAGDEPPEDVEWQRWAVESEEPRIRLRPFLADRPMVVRPESPLTIPPGVECLFYAMVPIWISLDVMVDDEPRPITQVPSLILSNTWFGSDTMTGDLCYAMRTTARRSLDNLPDRPHRAVCAVRVCNDSSEPVECLRLCMRVSHMSIFEHKGRLWTSSVVVRHRMHHTEQDLEYQNVMPDGVTLKNPLTLPQEKARGRILGNTIGSMILPGWIRGD